MEASQPVFFYDLGDPESYLVGEQIMGALPVAPEWEPVRSSELFGAAGVGAARFADPGERADLARRARALDLQPLRWPERWPPDSDAAMLTAAYAKRIGRAVAYSLAAFRQAFAGGRDLSDPDTVLIAAAACEMHPAAVLKGMELRSTREGLAQGEERARGLAIRELPAIEIDGTVLHGPDCLAAAAQGMG